MADEKPNEQIPEQPSPAAEPEPMADDLSDSELENASGGEGGEFQDQGANAICGWNC
jgi:hypothetical protein